MRSAKLYAASDLDGDRYLIVLADEFDCSGLSVVDPDGSGDRYPFELATLAWDLVRMSPGWLGTGQAVRCWIAFWDRFGDPATAHIEIVDPYGVAAVVREGMIVESE